MMPNAGKDGDVANFEAAAAAIKQAEFIPKPEDAMDALGIPNWRELEKQVVRRLDMTAHVVPSVQAHISSPAADLNLSEYDYSTAVTILSVGYITGQIPSNMIIIYLSPSAYLCCCAIVWPGVSAATVGATNAPGVWTVRFILGIVEAPLFPGAIYLLGCWHTRKEIAVRVAILYTRQTLALFCAGLIATAVFGTLEWNGGLRSWQWLFIVLAICGVGTAIAALFILPDYPLSPTESAMWSMTEDMHKVTAAHIVADRVSSEAGKAGVWQGLLISVKDSKLWLLVGVNVGLSAAYSFSNFAPSIVEGFGYSRVITLPLAAPLYIWAALASLVNACYSDKVGERGYHYIIPVFIGCAGYIICLATQDGGSRYGASFIFVCGMYISNSLVMSWVPATMGKIPQKRAVDIAMANVLGQIGNIIAPYFVDEFDRPRYQMAFILIMIFALISVSCAGVSKFFLKRENKKRWQEAVAEEKAYQPYFE